jgi:CHAD domain-containing protein
VLPESALKRRDDLGWIGQVLGAVRDLDVQIDQLDTWLGGLEEADREALMMLRSLLLEQRESARAAMLEMLDSRRYEAFIGRFGRTLRARHLARSGPASRPARALAPDLIEGRVRSVRKAGARIGPASPATEYHRLRIRCKRLRYALEFLADLYPGATRPLIGRLVTVQEVLGLHQDADVAIERLRHLAVTCSNDLDSGTIFAMGEVAERYRQSMIELRARFPAAYTRLSGRKWKAFHKRLECERPGPPAPAGDARVEPDPAVG